MLTSVEALKLAKAYQSGPRASLFITPVFHGVNHGEMIFANRDIMYCLAHEAMRTAAQTGDDVAVDPRTSIQGEGGVFYAAVNDEVRRTDADGHGAYGQAAVRYARTRLAVGALIGALSSPPKRHFVRRHPHHQQARCSGAGDLHHVLLAVSRPVAA